MALPISGVSLGTQSEYGIPGFVGSAQGIFPPSLLETGFGRPLTYLDGDGSGPVDFYFAAAYIPETPRGVNFSFTELASFDQLLSGIPSFGNNAIVSSITIENVAHTIAPPGIEPNRNTLSAAPTLIFFASEPSHPFHLLEFVDPYIIDGAGGVQLPLGGGPIALTGGLTVGNTLEGGWIEEILAPRAIVPEGFDSSLFGSSRWGDQPPVNFFFLDAYNVPRYNEVNFHFGDGRAPLAPPSITKADTVSAPFVANAALSFTPTPWESSKVPRSFQFSRDTDVLDGNQTHLILFNFVQTYIPESPLNVPFYFAGLLNLNVGSWQSSQFGTPGIANFDKELYPDGWVSSKYGIPTAIPIFKFDQWIVFTNTTSWESHQFGLPFVGTRQYLNMTPGFAASEYQFKVTTQDGDEVFAEDRFGHEPLVAFFVRYANIESMQASGDWSHRFGNTAWFSHSPRYIEPEGHFGHNRIYAQLGNIEVSRGLRQLTVEYGIDSLVFPPNEPSFSRGEQYVANVTLNPLLGVGLTQYGTLGQVYNYAQGISLQDRGIYDFTWTLFKVENSDQYADVYWTYADADAVATKFGLNDRPFSIRLRDVYVTPQPIVRDPYFTWGTFTSVKNNAIPYDFEGWESSYIAPRWDSDTFVGYAVRTFEFQGWESHRFGNRYTWFVSNAAFGVQPPGWQSAYVSFPFRVFDPTQFSRVVFWQLQTSYGTTWVSDAIRTISGLGDIVQDPRWVPGPERISNYTNYIEPEGWEDLRFGWYTEMRETFNIFKAAYSPVPGTSYGQPYVYNNTPQLFVFGRRPVEAFGEQCGRPFVDFAIRTIKLDDRHAIRPAYVIPEHTVTLRHRTYFLLGWGSSVISNETYIYNTELYEEWDGVIRVPGIPAPDVPEFAQQPFNRFGNFSSRVALIEVPSILSDIRFGNDTTFFNNGIMDVTLGRTRTYPGNPDSGFGIPTLNPDQFVTDVSLNNQFLYDGLARDMPNGLIRMGKHDTKPRTIWCTFDVTQQTKNNHPGKSWNYFARNADETPYPAQPANGIHFIPPSHRVFIPGQDQTLWNVRLFNNSISRMGEVDIELRHRTIWMEAIEQTIFGYPKFPTIQEIFPLSEPYDPEFDDDDDWDESQGQKPRVLYGHRMGEVDFYQEIVPFNQSIQVYGHTDSSTGTFHIENFHRYRDFEGWVAGTKFGNNTPMVYHYPRTAGPIGGGEMTQWGYETWIVHYTRNFTPESWDNFEAVYMPLNFNDLMRVQRQGDPFAAHGWRSMRPGYPRFVHGDPTNLYVTAYMIPPPLLAGEHTVEHAA